MRFTIAVVPGFGRLYNYPEEAKRCRMRISDCIANGDLPENTIVVRLPRRMEVKWVSFEKPYELVKD